MVCEKLINNNMKICYFGQLDISKPSGIVKKFPRQAIYWKKQGNEVNAFILTTSSHSCDEIMSSDIELFLYEKNPGLVFSNNPFKLVKKF